MEKILAELIRRFGSYRDKKEGIEEIYVTNIESLAKFSELKQIHKKKIKIKKFQSLINYFLHFKD